MFIGYERPDSLIELVRIYDEDSKTVTDLRNYLEDYEGDILKLFQRLVAHGFRDYLLTINLNEFNKEPITRKLGDIKEPVIYANLSGEVIFHTPAESILFKDYQMEEEYFEDLSLKYAKVVHIGTPEAHHDFLRFLQHFYSEKCIQLEFEIFSPEHPTGLILDYYTDFERLIDQDFKYCVRCTKECYNDGDFDSYFLMVTVIMDSFRS